VSRSARIGAGDDDEVDVAGLHVGHQALPGGAVRVAAAEPAVLVGLGEHPAVGPLALCSVQKLVSRI
jgi:hypothetical protein